METVKSRKPQHLRVGIIAENQSDVDVIATLLKRTSNKQLAVEQFVGNGSGKLRRKAGLWAEALVVKGCSRLLLVHDLDEHDLGRVDKVDSQIT